MIVRDARIGEIRLQWWRDALSADASSGHPIADAMRDLVERRSLDRGDVLALVEGYGRELYEDGVSDAHALDLYVDETEGAAIRLALAILGVARAQIVAGSVENAARALALTRLALTLPQHLAHGRLPLPVSFTSRVRDPRGADIADARENTRILMTEVAREARASRDRLRLSGARIDRGARAAFLPIALVDPYLSAALEPGRDVLEGLADISPLSRVVRLWFAHWRGRI